MWYAGMVCLLAVAGSDLDQVLSAGGLPAASSQAAGNILPGPITSPSAGFDPSSFDQSNVGQYNFNIGNSAVLDEPVVELPALQLTATYLPRFDHAGFGVFSFDLRHTWLMGYDEIPPLNVTPGGAVHLWSGPDALDLPSRVYDAYVDFSWRPIEWDRGGISCSITPGLYGDFERIDSYTFQWAGWLMADLTLGNDWTMMGGVAYYRQLLANWLPVGGAVWTPNDDTRVELLFPQPKFARRLYVDDTRTDWGYLGGQFGGGAWSVADTPDTNVLVNYSDLRLLVGWQSATIHGREWRVEFGYVFARDLGVNNTSVYTPSDSVVAQALFAF